MNKTIKWIGTTLYGFKWITDRYMVFFGYMVMLVLIWSFNSNTKITFELIKTVALISVIVFVLGFFLVPEDKLRQFNKNLIID